MRLIVSTQRGVVGTITYENGRLIGSDSGLQEIADSKVRYAGSAEAAFEMLSGYSNGYVAYDPEEEFFASEDNSGGR
jgi:hypothetical protein